MASFVSLRAVEKFSCLILNALGQTEGYGGFSPKEERTPVCKCQGHVLSLPIPGVGGGSQQSLVVTLHGGLVIAAAEGGVAGISQLFAQSGVLLPPAPSPALPDGLEYGPVGFVLVDEPHAILGGL